MEKQIFISYRRDGAEALAQLLYSRLTSEGYGVFLDVKSLNFGLINESLYKEIERCEDFLLVLSPNGLDRCVQENDPLRLEIEYALKLKKNIVPVMMQNFTFPKNLPKSLSELSNYNGVSADITLHDVEGVILKLKRMFVSKPGTQDFDTKFPLTKDPNFSNGFFEKYFINEQTEKESEKLKLDFADKDKLHQTRYDGYGLIPFFPAGCINYANEAYEIYDIFIAERKKYAYTLKADKFNLNEALPEVTFFEIDKNDNCRKLENSDADALLPFYSVQRRGLGILPKTLRLSAEDFYEALSSKMNVDTDVLDSLLPVLALENLISPKSISGIWNRGFRGDVALEIALNERYQIRPSNFKSNNLKAIIENYYIGVFDDSLSKSKNVFRYSNRNSFWVSKVKTPFDDYTILDIATVHNMSNSFIVFTYPQRKNLVDQLKKIPTFFFVRKDTNGYLSIERICDEQKFKMVKPLMERFAIVAAQIDRYFPAVFM